MGADQNLDISGLEQDGTAGTPPDSPPPRRTGRDVAIIGLVSLVVAGMIFYAVRRPRIKQADAGPVTNVHELEGRPAPSFTLKTLDGATANLADYRGKAVMLDFW